MAGLFQPKRVQVPGLLSDDGLTAALSNLTATTKAVGAKAPPNTSAVDAADSIFKEALKAEPGLRNVKPRVPGTELKMSPDARSSAMGKGISDAVQSAPVLSQVASAITQLGTFTDPAVQLSEQKIIVDELKQKEQTIKDAQALGEMMNKGFESQPLDPEVLPLALEREAKRRRDLIEAGQDVAAAEKILPTQAWWLNAVQVGTRSALDMGVGTFRAPADLWDTVATIATKGGDAKVEKSDVSVWIDGIDKALTNMLPGDKARSKQFVTELAAGTGSMTGFMIAGWAGKAVGLPAGAVTATLGALTEADSMYQDADGFSATATQKFIALMAGAGLGTTEAIPIDRMFMRADVGTGGMIRRLLENTTAGSLEEFIQEASQSLGEDIVAKYAYDPSRKIDPVKAFESGLIGGITGGATASVTTVLSGNNEVDPVKMDEVQQTEAVDAALEEESRRFAAIIGDEAADLGDGQDGVAPAPASTNESAPGGGQAAAARPDPVVVDKPRGDAVQQILKPVAAVKVPSDVLQQDVVLNPSAPVEQQVSVKAAPAIDTPQFKTFFKDSKAVTPTGAPLVVYHGTGSKFTAFDPKAHPVTDGGMGLEAAGVRPFFFSASKEIANDFAGGDPEYVMPVYLSLQKPLEIDAKGTGWTEFNDEIVAAAKGGEYDGVILRNLSDTMGLTDVTNPVSDVYVAFEPTQIKSAIANNGDFDPTNPNIDQQVADPIAAAVQSAQPEASELEPLPNHEKKTSGPVPMVVKAARAYAAATGMPLRRQREYVKVDVARATRIAQAYTDMKHEPNDPAVAAAYKALAGETKAQYRYVLATGLKIESMKEGQPDPYPEGPGKHVREDLLNGHLWYYPTKFGFGSDASFDPSTNPLLEETEFKNDAGETMLVNDLFRVVHDFFGHGMEGAGFGARGEENAWQAHMRLFSESAIPAMTSETRGQNSWVNYGPFGAANRADPKNTVYADQKTGIMPSWTWQEGVEDTAAYGISAPVEMTPETIVSMQLAGTQVTDATGAPLVVYHGTPKKFSGAFDASKIGKRGDANDGFAFTSDRSVAEGYKGKGLLNRGEIKEVFLNMKNPRVVDMSGRTGDTASMMMTKGIIIDGAKMDGNDGVIFRNIADNADLTDKRSDVYIVFNADQIVQRDAVPDVMQGANQFRDALLAAKAASKHGAVVHAYTAAEYSKMRLFLAPDGKAGFALKGDDIVSVFSQGGGRLRSIMDTALANGGQRLDAFDGFLPKAYARLGFRETKRLPWDESQRPEGWTDDMGKPDVVFMEYASSDIDLSVASYGTATKEFMDWDDGAAIRYSKENGYGDDRAEAGGLGTPLVLYSGAPHDLRVATRAMWLTPDRGTAEQFANGKDAEAQFDEDGNNIGGSVFTFHARMENPFEYDWEGNNWSTGPETEYPTVYRVGDETYSSYADAEQAISDMQDSARSDAEEAFRDDMANRMYVAPVGERFEVRLKPAEVTGGASLRSSLNYYDIERKKYLDMANAEGVTDFQAKTYRDQVKYWGDQIMRVSAQLAEIEVAKRAVANAQDEVLGTFDAEEEARDFENTYSEEGAVAAGDEAADAVDTNIEEETDYESEGSGQTTDSVVQYARASGYDGVIFRDVDEGNGPVDVYVVITPGNAKSTANLGQWDRANPDILRMTGTATMRAPFKAEQTRPTKGIATPSPDPGNQDDVRLSKISRDFVTLLKLTARHGRLASKGSAVMGEYHRRAATIRLRTWTDLSTLVHEGGHAINDSMSAPMNAFVQANISEINNIAHTYYPGDLSQAPSETVRREGFAEFFRVYTLNPSHARNKWPQLVASFEAVLKQEDPKILDGLGSIAASFSAWLQLPSRQLIRNMVVDGRREQGINAAVKELREQGFKTWMHEHARRSTEWLINRYASIADLETQLLNLAEKNRGAPIELNRSDSPTTIMRLARNAGSRAQVQITDGIIGYRSTMSSSRGLREALMTALKVNPDTTPASLDEELMKDFDAYLIARRAFDEYRRFDLGEIERPPIGAQKGDVIRAIKEYEKTQPQFTAAAAIVHEYGMAMWQKRYDAGLMDKETYEEGLQRQFYAPLQRDVSDKQGSGADSLHFGSSVLTKGPRFKGSDRDIISPMTVLMQMTFALEKQIAENDAKKALAVLADRAGQAGALVERIPASQLIGQSFSVQQVAQRLTADSGLTAADASDLLTILSGSIDKGDMMTLFRSEQAGTQGENVLFFWENGKVAAIRLNDSSLAADVVNTMNAVGRENMDLLLEGVAATSTVFRTAITSWPDFLMINYIRDQFSAWILTDVGYTPFVTGLGGIADEIRQKQWAKSYNAAGGILGGMNVAALHTARVDRDIKALRAKGYIANVFGDVNGGWSNVPGAIKGLARLTAITETGTRLGIYKKAYQRAIKDGLSEYDASVEAAYIATDYIDFGLNGNKMLTARRTIPFLNAQLQGLYKMVRTLGGDEVARRKGLKFALGAFFKSTKNMPLSRTEKQAIRTGRAAWLKMMSLGLISAALWAVFKDDPDYEEAGEYLRTTGWVIPMGNGKIAYIPKPFELAMIANAVERGLEFASGDATAVDRFKRGVAFALTPPTAPPAIQSLVEVAANYDFFTGTEIVPTYMKALDPQLQYDNYTSSIAKWVGSATGLSPLVVDHVLSGMGASAYRDISTMINAADPTRPAPDETDMPIIRRFVRDVRRGSASAQDFWAQASNTNGKMAQGAATYKKFMEMGNEPAANRFLSTLDADRRAYAVLMTDFKPEEKRLNPFYRARQVTSIVSGMRTENGSALGLGDTSREPVVGEGPLTLPPMSRGVRAQVDDILSEIARREVRNTMIATEQPGWKGKDILPLEPTLDLLLAVSPDTYDEYNRRRVKAKVYDAQAVFDYWPEVRDRLVQDGPDAILSDAVAIAGVVF